MGGPVVCTRDDAWLGNGFYFWDDLNDADRWGQTSKKATGWYEIYEATIDCQDVLDTVFNEAHYRFWLRQVEKAATVFVEKTGMKPTLKEINTYFRERGQWDDLAGILFQDVPTNQNYVLVQRFFYRKRIQLVVYKLEIIGTFAFFKEETCS